MRRLAGLNLLLHGCVCSLLAVASAQADELTLAKDVTVLVSLPNEPTTIIVSNPNVADVTVRASSLLFLGKGFGSTNVIVLDENGGEMHNWDVHVINADPYGVSVFKAGKRENYTCKTDCEGTGQSGAASAN